MAAKKVNPFAAMIAAKAGKKEPMKMGKTAPGKPVMKPKKGGK